MLTGWKVNFPVEGRYFETENGILYHGEAITVMSKFPGSIFDAIITDPPYGTTACKWDNVIPFDDMWRELKRIRKDRTPIVLFGSEPFSSMLRVSNLQEYKYDWIWNKKKSGNPFLSKIQPVKITENIIVFGKSKINYYPIMEKRDKPKRRGKNKGKISETTNNVFIDDKVYYFKYPKNIIEISNANQRNKHHPTQKPIALLEYLVKTYTNEGGLVLDFTCGSGTTLVACKKLNRRWVGIELEGKYCEIAKSRMLEAKNGSNTG